MYHNSCFSIDKHDFYSKYGKIKLSESKAHGHLVLLCSCFQLSSSIMVSQKDEHSFCFLLCSYNEFALNGSKRKRCYTHPEPITSTTRRSSCVHLQSNYFIAKIWFTTAQVADSAVRNILRLSQLFVPAPSVNNTTNITCKTFEQQENTTQLYIYGQSVGYALV